jgi:phosphatidylinositol kinase/protein kinase (PI-3  family)
VYHPLARELFNAGFVNCWSQLDDNNKSEVVRAIEFAFGSPNLPQEVLTTLLNLAEFMEQDDKVSFSLKLAITDFNKYIGYFSRKMSSLCKSITSQRD